MAVIDFPSKAKERIYRQFPPLSLEEMPRPDKMKTIEIEYERKAIENYDVVFWHRLLKTIYQEPHEMQCVLLVGDQSNKGTETVILRRLEEKSKWQILSSSEEVAKKIQEGGIKLLPVNWKYFFRLPSSGIIEISTKDQHTLLYFAHVVLNGQIKDADRSEAEKFIDSLLDEARRVGNHLFNPLKEFKKTEGLKLYLLFNVYRANYVSAEFMLSEAENQEKYLTDEFLKYDARTGDYHDEEKREHIDQFMLARGMYFLSAITYLFMALEGFINIVFHSFLKKDLRNSELNIEQRFDIEQKLKLMTALCNGFTQEADDSNDDIYSKFLKLKNYRNSIFHSKVEDSLKSFVFIEDGFLYNCDISKYKEQFLPSQKIMLSAADVKEVKKIVDSIIELILTSMTDETRLLTNKYILNSTHIPFYILTDGSLSMGKSDKE